jgi:hypothetical protein
MADVGKKDEVVKNLAEMEEKRSVAGRSETSVAAGEAVDDVAVSLEYEATNLPVIEEKRSTAGACRKENVVGVAPTQRVFRRPLLSPFIGGQVSGSSSGSIQIYRLCRFT